MGVPVNEVVDFRLDLMPDSSDDICYSFRFGKCEDFWGALELVKSIPVRQRRYDEEDDHLWTIEASAENFDILCRAFDNFAKCYEVVKMQLRLPGL